jgi:hypothetical protein
MVGCPTLSGAEAELELDAETLAMLRQEGYRPRDYIRIGWTVLIAANPKVFRVHPGETLSANMSFLARRRAEVKKILYPDGP